jgi:hypothetical protein
MHAEAILFVAIGMVGHLQEAAPVRQRHRATGGEA